MKGSFLKGQSVWYIVIHIISKYMLFKFNEQSLFQLMFRPNLQVVLRDADKLHQMIEHTAEIADKVSSKVRKLDLAKVSWLGYIVE